MMKVSIIIALYNTEKYIDKCIQSVLDCSLPSVDYEIIVINDGSTDNSKTIVEKLIKANPNTNFQLINKENGGQSSARNLGFKKAKGEYIFCLDSDDYLDGDKIKEALNFAIENKLDMLPIQLIRVDESGEKTFPKDSYEKLDEIISGAEFLNRFVISGAMARYFYKTEIIKKNNLQLIEGIYHEDEEFIIRFLSHVNRITYNQLPVYYYLFRQGSTVQNKDFKHRKKLIYDIITVIKSLDEIITNTKDIGIKNGVDKKKQQLLLSVFLRMYKEKFNKEVVNEIILIFKKANYYPLNTDKLNWKQKVVANLLNLPIVTTLIYK